MTGGEQGAARSGFDVDAYRRTSHAWKATLPEGVSVAQSTRPDIKGAWITSPGVNARRRILYLHGGGGIAGTFASHAGIAGWLARHADCAVFFCDYRLAPEHPFPAGLDDAAAALKHLYGNGPSGPDMAEAVFVGGDSAGGALSLGAALAAKAEGTRLPDAAFLLCPMLDWDEKHSSVLAKSAFRAGMASAYRQAADPRNPLLSPVFADLAGLPPLFIQAGLADEFAPDAQAIARSASTSGVSHILDNWPEMQHVWQREYAHSTDARRALEKVAQFLNKNGYPP